MSAQSAFIEGIAVKGPGLNDWAAAAAILAGYISYVGAPVILPLPPGLPPAERRRTGRIVRLALALGMEATEQAALDPSTLPVVFSASGGDGDNCHEICETLASSDRQVSPTRFHNSVHNAPAGYWSIAVGSRAPSTVLCAHDASFAAGLLESLTSVAVDGTSVLLIACETSYPPPLHFKRPLSDAFGIALALTPVRSARSLAFLQADLVAGEADRLEEMPLESLRRASPAARGLPLLRLLARQQAGAVQLEYLGGNCLRAQVTPC